MESSDNEKKLKKGDMATNIQGRGITTVLLSLIAGLIIALNIYLIYQTIIGG